MPDIYTSSCAGGPSGVAFMFAPPQPVGTPAPPASRKALYRPTLSKLRQLMICRMAKPEEVMRPTAQRCAARNSARLPPVLAGGKVGP